MVADGNLACGAESRLDEHDIQKSRVEDNVAMVADEGVSSALVDGGVIHVAALACLGEKVLEEWIAESYLEIKVGLTLH